MRCARLTSAQAALVALDVWRAAGDLRPAGTKNGAAHLDAVRIDEYGNATLTSATSLTGVVSALCGCLGGAPDELRSVLAEVQATADRAAFERLADAVAPVERSTRLELGALVKTWTAAQPGAAAPRPVPDDQQPPPWVPPPAPGLGRRIWHYAWRPLAGLLVFAVVVGVELTSLRTQLERDLGRLGGLPNVRLGKTSTAPTTSAAPSLGPPASGAVLGVTVRTVQPCRPGTTCPVTVAIQVQPAHKATKVGWSVRVVDACRNGAPVVRPGGSVRVHAGASRVVVVRNVHLPHGSALDLYAVTDRPATAASPPLQIPVTKSGTPRC